MSFLKSISISEDLLVPSRATHYRPTKKSLDIVRAVLGEGDSQATSVIASYGSGKSLAALVGGLLADADTTYQSDLNPVIERLERVDPDLAEASASRLESKAKGSVISLSGYVPDLPLALAKGLGLNKPRSMEAALAAILRYLKRNKHDRLAIIWDEFGRHLERLVSTGRSEELLEVQQLAEWVVRRKAPIATLTVLLHQNFQRYSGRLSQSGQNAWRKIEGRFDTLTIVEDSDEMYEFIAELTSEATGSDSAVQSSRTNFTALAQQSANAGFFSTFEDQVHLENMLEQAWPLTPSAFYLLPRISARVGQNERTVFSFLSALSSETSDQPVTIEHLFTHFAEAMRQDTGPGGVHRRLVETESARARAESELEKELLAAVCLLQLGGGGERDHLSMSRLQAAMLAGSTYREQEITDAIDALVARKLLLYRRRTDDVSVWHGADIDLRAKVSELIAELAAETDILGCLNDLAPPLSYTAPRYNFDYSLTRYAPSVYVRLQELVDPETRDFYGRLADDNDGLVALVVDGTNRDIHALDKSWLQQRSHLIVAIPHRTLDLEPATLELEALKRLSQDKELLSLDPLIERELAELKTNAFEYLTSRLELLTEPENGGVAWYSKGQPVEMEAPGAVYEVLSNVFEDRFPKTPKIRNEQIVRRKVTAQSKSARKRCILGVLERTGDPELGYSGATSADASIFRTIFGVTDLYRSTDTAGKWVTEPSDLSDPGMSLAWGTLKEFFSTPREEPKHFEELIKRLTNSPIGLRTGTLPLLIAAGLKAFGSCLALRQNIGGRWAYVDDIQPTVVEAIAENPEAFELEVISRTKKQVSLINLLTEEFNPILDTQETDQVRAFYDAVYSWRRNLPPSALKARGLGDEATLLQRVLRQTDGDPVHLLFRAFPDIASRDTLDNECVAYISRARQQIEQLTAVYTERAIAAARMAFSGQSASKGASLLDAASTWAKILPITLDQHTALDRLSKGIISRARQALNGRYTEASFVRALSGMLSGKDFEEWDDMTAREFEQSLRANLRKIEDAALSLDDEAEGLPLFLESKVRSLLDKHAKVAGQNATKELINEILRKI
ncbi:MULTISPECIES: hypothetical protein [unclassified Ruegeria]|uniref:hypothetical protein n=1 Tax=unclassified Ruegeria TaxID=2625375 RepID=UPI00149230A5|nr:MULTISPECIES: hypothetical protein [unclassified Ruegeria]NOD36646.1 hypothetical protein [Ruegeria sp. HKCCD7296]NOE43855.1 hypothetical protein [Ruegeria sp. HKCCD7319]